MNLLATEGFLAETTELKDIVDQQNDLLEKTLHLTIMTHQNCNFRCTYCYEKFDKGKMCSDVQKNIIDYVIKQFETDDFQHFVVSWFGGEPLLGMSVIENLSETFITLSQQFNIHYSANITTNGYYLTKKCKETF